MQAGSAACYSDQMNKRLWAKTQNFGFYQLS